MFFADYKNLDETLALFDKYIIDKSSNSHAITKSNNRVLRGLFLLALLISAYKIIRWYWWRKDI